MLTDCAIVILIHGLEILLEGGFVELSIWLHAKEHTTAELAHLTLLELAVVIYGDALEQLLRRLHELGFIDLCLGHSAMF